MSHFSACIQAIGFYGILLLSASHCHAATVPAGNGIIAEKLLETSHSWDGAAYPSYPAGTPQISVLKITLPPHAHLAWHQHPIPSAAYILAGDLTVEKWHSKAQRHLKTGEALPEMVDSIHRGIAGDKGAVLIVFYAGHKGIPLSRPADTDAASLH